MEALLGDGGGPRRLVQPLGEPGGAPSWVPERRPERFDRAVGSLDALAERITDAHRVPDPPEDVVSTLLEAVDAGEIDERQVRDEVVTILLAGHETTALVLTYAWFLLSKDDGDDGDPARSGEAGASGSPADRLRAEVDALEGSPGTEDLGSLSYTEAVVNESMRLYPPSGRCSASRGSIPASGTTASRRGRRWWFRSGRSTATAATSRPRARSARSGGWSGSRPGRPRSSRSASAPAPASAGRSRSSRRSSSSRRWPASSTSPFARTASTSASASPCGPRAPSRDG